MEGWIEEIAIYVRCTQVVVSRDGDVVHGYAIELLDHREIHGEKWCDICNPLSYAVLRPLHLRPRLYHSSLLLLKCEAHLRVVGEAVCVRCLYGAIDEDRPEGFECRGIIDRGVVEVGIECVDCWLVDGRCEDHATQYQAQQCTW